MDLDRSKKVGKQNKKYISDHESDLMVNTTEIKWTWIIYRIKI